MKATAFLNPDRAARSILIGGAALWCLLIVAAPLFDLAWVYQFFAFICHQNPLRSWSLGTEPLAVCIRCASIYFGFLLGLVANVPPRSGFLKASLAATLSEFLMEIAGLGDFAALRALTGLALGLAGAGFVAIGVGEMLAARLGRPLAGAQQ
jgi:uncharacterized membrane protein